MGGVATGNTEESGAPLPLAGGAVPTLLAQHRMRRALPMVIKQVLSDCQYHIGMNDVVYCLTLRLILKLGKS